MAVNATVLAATLQDRSKGYLNIISAQIALFMWLKQKGQYKGKSGGTKIEWDLEVVLDTTEPSYAGADNLPVKFSDSVITATANWKNYAKSIAFTGEEKRKNGAQKVFDLIEQKETNALESMQQQLNEHFYLDGTGNSSKRVTGLAAIIASANTTGTLFGVSRTNSYWQNRKIDTNKAAYEVSAKEAHMVDDMSILKTQCGRQKIGGVADRYPDLILCTETYFQRYEQVLQRIGQRFTTTKVGDAGFVTIEYKGITIIQDEDCPADAGGDAQGYMINSRFMELIYHKDANFKTTATIEQEDQDAFSSKVLWMGELIAKNLGKHGIQEGVKAVA